MPALLTTLHRPRRAAAAHPSLRANQVTSAALLRWFDAVPLVSAGVMPTWPDTSGNAQHATQGTALNQPVVVLNAYNGKPTVRFDAGNTISASTWMQFPVTAAVRCALIVARHRRGWWDGGSSQVGVLGDPTARDWQGDSGVMLFNLTNSAAALRAGTIETNGHDIGSPTGQNKPVALTSLLVKATGNLTASYLNRDGNQDGNCGEWDVCEVALFDAVPSPLERAALWAGTQATWGIATLPWLAIDGNSMLVYQLPLGDSSGPNFASEFLQARGYPMDVRALPVTGQGWPDMIGDGAAQFGPLQHPDSPASLIAANEDDNAMNGPTPTAASVDALAQQYFADRRTDGFTAPHSIRLTCVNRDDAGTSPDSDTFEGKRLTLNGLSRGHDPALWKIGDMGADARMSPRSACHGPFFHTDFLHPSVVGAEVVIGPSIAAAAVRARTGNPAVFLQVPNGGELAYVGDVLPIQWVESGVTGAGAGTVKVELSRDGGSSWSTLTASTTNTRLYNWTVSGAPSTNCLVRVSDTANGATVGLSAAPFAIQAAPSPVWAPTSEGNLIAWLDAQHASVDPTGAWRAWANGRRVRRLTDQGPGLLHLAGTRTTKCPTVKAGGAGLFPSLVFDGARQYLTNAAWPATNTITVVASVKLPAVPVSGIALSVGNFWWMAGNITTGGAKLAVGYGTAVHGWLQQIHGNTSLLANQWMVLGARYDGSNWQFRFNHAADGTIAETGNLASNSGTLYLGSYEGQSLMQGMEVETLAVFGALSDASWDAADAYCNARVGAY